MNIDSVRDMFRELSGRRTLDDDAVDVYLNAGLRFLDDLVNSQHNRARIVTDILSGVYYYKFRSPVKVIETISLYDGNARMELIQLNIADLQTISPTLFSSNDHSLPEYYAVACLRRAPMTTSLTSLGDNYHIIETGDPSSYNGVVFNCPTDKTYKMDLSGQFYSELQQNWWIVNYPLTAVHAALCKLEVGYRNSEGMKDWLASIKIDIGEISKNKAEQDSYGITRMEG
jgi:hypothetical protein